LQRKCMLYLKGTMLLYTVKAIEGELVGW
jgi:hypothetical protein